MNVLRPADAKAEFIPSTREGAGKRAFSPEVHPKGQEERNAAVCDVENMHFLIPWIALTHFLSTSV